MRVSLTSLLLLILHLTAGYFIYCGFSFLSFLMDDSTLFKLSLVVVLASWIYRSSRLDKIDTVLLGNLKRSPGIFELWGAEAVVLYLGPCEALLPVLVKARQMGDGLFGVVLGALVAFSAGTLIIGLLLITFSRDFWNRPVWLTRGIQWAHRSGPTVPVWVMLGASLILLLKI